MYYIKQIQCPDCNKWNVMMAEDETRAELKYEIPICPDCLAVLDSYNLQCRIIKKGGKQ